MGLKLKIKKLFAKKPVPPHPHQWIFALDDTRTKGYYRCGVRGCKETLTQYWSTYDL